MFNRLRFQFVIAAVALALIMTAGAGAGLPARAQTAPLRPLTIFVGYIANIQFAPLYVAIERGYFAQAGFDAKIEYSFNETDGLSRIGVNQLQFGLLSGEQIILARAKGAPVVYVASWYQRFPVGIVVPADSSIQSPKDLAGKNVSVSAKYGASYIGFQALLNAVGLTEASLKSVQEIGFNTAPVMCSGKVDASVVYVANEPLQIESTCFKTRVFPIADYANLASNGLVTNEQTISDHPDWVRGITSAFVRGLQDTIADPAAAYTIAQKYVDNLGDDPVQKQVLAGSITLWMPPTGATVGSIDPARWDLTQKTLLTMKLLDAPVDLAKAVNPSFLPTPTIAATAPATTTSP
jgi:NitT/TauT family transport system substrate-binding protein